MKNRLYTLGLLCALLVFELNVNAQTTRYKDFVFDSVKTTTVTYSNAWSTPLLMDVYEPKGDVVTNRPVIILAHGGSFVTGTRGSDATVSRLCVNFARRGYVTASIDYRLDTVGYTMNDSSVAVNTVLKAVSDGKAAIRYFRKDAHTTNTFNIDTNTIFVGGNSAGAVLYLHIGYIDSVEECSAPFQAVINANGGLDGNSGNPGYSSRVSGVINCAGALNQPGFIGIGDVPSANFQGSADGTVPYDCGYPESALVPVRLCGLGVLEGYYNKFCINHASYVFVGADHVPWDKSVPDFNIVDSITTSFLFSLRGAPDTVVVCPTAAINNIVNDQNINVFPNPTNNQFTVSLNDARDYQKIQLTDATGRLVAEKSVVAPNLSFDRDGSASGIYFVKIFRKDNSYSVRKVVFE